MKSELLGLVAIRTAHGTGGTRGASKRHAAALSGAGRQVTTTGRNIENTAIQGTGRTARQARLALACVAGMGSLKTL